MDWWKLESDLPDHPKVARFASHLGAPKDVAIARLVYLFCWVAKYRETGDLTGLQPDEVAEAARWRGNPEKLIDALSRSGFLDRDGESLQVHEWKDRYGGVFRARERACANRTRSVREACANATHPRVEESRTPLPPTGGRRRPAPGGPAPPDPDADFADREIERMKNRRGKA